MKKTVQKPTRTPVQDRRYQQAVDLFTKGVKALGRKDFDRARELFDALFEEHPDQKELLERARTYRAMCSKTRRPGRPKTFEELLNYGVILHNRGEFAQAVKFLRQALEVQPRNESALYCLAAAQARAGDPDAALQTLRSAISANPATRALARKDDDFEPLRGALEFRTLVSPTVS
jgi:tetratricopeptide (TPR) repeat protein